MIQGWQPSLPCLLSYPPRLNCHHDRDHVADGYDVNDDDDDSGHIFLGVVNMVIHQMAFVKIFTAYFAILVLIVELLSKTKKLLI